jgi:MFS superfamily sulfate permease-like transporter
VVAGVTLAGLAVPEVLGYARIAGMPVETGLYTLLVPVVVFALLGSSRHLVVGADSATAAILAAGLAGLAVPASARYVQLAGVAALLVAALLLLARLARLGFLADFLSRTVLVGFLTGVGIQVAAGQLGDMLGIRTSGASLPDKVVELVTGLSGTNAVAMAGLGVRDRPWCSGCAGSAAGYPGRWSRWWPPSLRACPGPARAEGWPCWVRSPVACRTRVSPASPSPTPEP